MWFKNLTIYRFHKTFSLSAEQLEKKLAASPFRTCGKTELASYGWIPPIPQGSAFVHESNQCLLFSLCQEERLLPASVIKEALAEKIVAIQAEQDRKVFSKEKKDLREEITLNLLPQAFTRKKTLNAYIDIKKGFLIIDTSSFAMAEKLTTLLRKNLGTLPITLLETNDTPSITMTAWLENPHCLPKNFTLNDECELIEPSEKGSIVQCKRQELNCEEMLQHLKTGKQVSKIAFQWKDALTGVIQNNLCIKRLKFTDELKEHSESDNNDDAALQADADFTLMALTLRAFINEVINTFGELSSVIDHQFTPIRSTEIKSESMTSSV